MLQTGMAGIGLLNLRCSVAAAFVDFAAHRSPLPSRLSWRLSCRQSHYASGRYASIITCLIELVAALRSGGQYVFNSITPASILANWECGAPSYLLDSRLFGRRIISFQVRGKADGL
jgi:hypothetical protein